MGLRDNGGFRRSRRGEISLSLAEHDRALLDNLIEQLSMMLAPDAENGPSGVPADPLAELVGIDPYAVRPADPALARLFPDAYADPEQADEFRRFTQRDLRTLKLRNAELCHATLARGNPARLSDEEAQAWLATLNDLRLTLGTRLGVSEDPIDVEQLADTDPAMAMYVVYDWLTYHQDRLVQALSKSLGSH